MISQKWSKVTVTGYDETINFIKKVCKGGYYVCDRDDILVAENKHFFLPGPQNSLDNVNL